jgi:hypothetical protein
MAYTSDAKIMIKSELRKQNDEKGAVSKNKMEPVWKNPTASD